MIPISNSSMSPYSSPKANHTTVDNLIDLEDLSEPSIMHDLRRRFYNQQIYTHLGPQILIAVNPHEVRVRVSVRLGIIPADNNHSSFS
jgi:myosin heavy subunit